MYFGGLRQAYKAMGWLIVRLLYTHLVKFNLLAITYKPINSEVDEQCNIIARKSGKVQYN